MGRNQRIVIVGATSAIATHCARLWVQDQAVNLILLGRDESRMERIAADLRVRGPQSSIELERADFLTPSDIDSVVNRVVMRGPVDLVLIAHGALPEQAICQSDLTMCQQALEINGVSPVLFAEAFAKHMAQADHGTLALIASVAGDRGRRSNYVYGAAKGLVIRYAQGLQHRFSGTGVKVVLIKPGPTDTPMTAHLKQLGAKLASVQDVARQIVDGVEKRQSVVYAPHRWRWIMLFLQHLPICIFNRMKI